MPQTDRQQPGVQALSIRGSLSSREGFQASGLDLSPVSLKLGREMLESWATTADLTCGSMVNLPYRDAQFEAVVDVFSSYCLGLADFALFLGEVRRVLRRGGRLFIYTPSIESDAFKNHSPATLLDERTLAGC